MNLQNLVFVRKGKKMKKEKRNFRCCVNLFNFYGQISKRCLECMWEI